MTATIDEVAKTLGEFEALAQKTGEWDGADPVEFSIDGITWLPVWSAVGDWRFPPFARATVHRKGVAAPTVMVVAWDESLPADDEWRGLWERKPMKLFGSFALRSAIRHAFRDVVGDLTGPDETTTGPGTAPTGPRDWAAEYRAAEDLDVLESIRNASRAARENTDPLNALYRERKAAIADAMWEPAPAENAAEVLHVEDESVELRTASGALRRSAEDRPGMPRDYLAPAGNRAERRAAKKKGRRK